MSIAQAPSEQAAIDLTMALCEQDNVLTQLGEQASALRKEVSNQINELYPRFVHASGALPAIDRRHDDRSLWIQSGVTAHELPPLETDEWHNTLAQALKDATMNEEMKLISCAMTVRRRVFDALHELFIKAIREAHGGILL